MSDFILEIGTEEIPARFLDSTQEELVNRFTTVLAEEGLSFDDMQSFATPRRATLYIKNLAEKQEVKEETFFGPAKKIAYTEDGSLSKAAQGFARGHKVSEEDIFIAETEKGEYIAVKKQVGGKLASEILENICPAIITALPFAKKMRWNNYTLPYARPMHWIVALLDNTVLKFSVGEIHSSNKTNGHRIHGEAQVEIRSANDYFSIIEKQSIELNAKKRKEIIVQQADEILAHKGAKILWNNALLDEVKGLVECPVPLLGDFDASFLELPREVLLTSMQSHQKSFGVEDAKGALLPHFLTVLNLHSKDVATVKKGWEKVLRARLEDARFFWKTDNAIIKENGFNTWLDKLDKVIFLGPLGSMGDKSRRLEKLMAHFAEKLQLNSQLAADAGRNAKADLVSAMVGEFDTLQGVMGGIYAKNIDKEELGKAIAEHYLPAGPETPVPTNDYAALLSLCDKADTLVGLFGLGNIPTGAADPYALRRNAISIARILRDKAWTLDIQEIFEKAFTFYNADIKWKFNAQEIQEKVLEFYKGRVKNLFLSEGNDPLFVEAAMNVSENIEMFTLAMKLQALIAFSAHEKYIPTVQSFKRISNIIRKQAASYQLSEGIDTNLFENEEERNFSAQLVTYTQSFANEYKANDFAQCYELLAQLSPTIDAFFESIMVMAEDEKVRQNRLNLLYCAQKPLTQLADFAALQI